MAFLCIAWAMTRERLCIRSLSLSHDGSSDVGYYQSCRHFGNVHKAIAYRDCGHWARKMQLCVRIPVFGNGELCSWQCFDAVKVLWYAAAMFVC